MTEADLTHEEIIELLGAYALDAVEPEEAEAVSAHLASCPRCALEVAGFREVAAIVANAGGDAPGDLWDRIAVRLDPPELRPLRNASFRGSLEPGRLVPGHRRAGWLLRSGASLLAAAAVAVIALLGVQVSHLDGKVATLQAQTHSTSVTPAVQTALLDPRAIRVALASTSGKKQMMAEIVILPSGQAFLVDRSLPPLPRNETYQLWGITDGEAISLGVLGSHPSAVPFSVDPYAMAGEFALTVENAGGVVVSTHAPVAVGRSATA